VRTLEHIGAVGVFILHCVVGVIIFLGWLWPSIWPLYVAILLIVFFQNWILGYCILSRWEFSLRRMINPKLRYKYNFTTYYTYKLTRQPLSTRFVQIMGTVFIASSLGITLFFRFLA
jgi:hypothetical protein